MILHPTDNVEVLLEACGDIPVGHKRALRPIMKGEDIIKYGSPIGHATQDVNAGEWVHSHNLATNLESAGQSEPVFNQKNACLQDCYSKSVADASFMGYLRSSGKVGVRNELWILPTVGCVQELAQRLATEMQKECELTVRAFPHPYGCSQLGEDHANTRSLLAALAQHPNAGGVLVLGLGCENNQISELRPQINSSRVRFMESQKVDDEIEEGLRILRDLYAIASHDERTRQPFSKLVVGLKCGGSDGFSGITANPLLGRFSDLVTSLGGTAILTEVPEMFGAEHLLMARCKDEETFQKTVSLIDDFKNYYRSHNLPVGENPSPGNKEGGITTLEEKSLGCVQKGGTSTVVDVLQYADIVKTPGLNLLCGPGNDLVASTALAASGCQIVLFTTGRGTPFGTCVPTLKVSTNSNLAARKPHWIDFNAGTLLEGKEPDAVLKEFVEKVIATLNGAKVNNEIYNYSSIAIWKGGVTL